MALNGHKLNGSSRVMLSALKAAIRHAILVMLALPDGHDPRRYQLRSIWLPTAAPVCEKSSAKSISTGSAT